MEVAKGTEEMRPLQELNGGAAAVEDEQEPGFDPSSPGLDYLLTTTSSSSPPSTPTTNHQRTRKQSILPQIELEEYNWRRAELSPYGSIRKKFVFTVPGVLKQEQPREYKLKAIVVFLFFLIVIYISLTYVFHKQRQLQLLQIEIGERIHFREDSRILRFFNAAKQEVLVGHIGMALPVGTPHNCLQPSSLENKCLEWKQTARLQMTHLSGANHTTRCFNIVWQSLHPDFNPHDCYLLSGHWYGMGELKDQQWPLENNNVSSQPFVTGNVHRDAFGNLLNRYWISSKGVNIFVDKTVPLYVSINEDAFRQLCFRAKYTNSFSTINNRLPVLNYTICTSSDIKTLHSATVEQFHNLPRMNHKMNLLMKNIVWETDKLHMLNQDYLSTFIDDIVSSELTTFKSGIVVINEGWQKEAGDFLLDEDKFIKGAEEIKTLRSKGFIVILKVNPYVSTSSEHYLTGIENGTWILDARGLVPGLTKWDYLNSAAIIDFTNNLSVSWFKNKLQHLHEHLKVDGFYFLGGETSNLPLQYVTSNPVNNLDELAYLYAQTACNSNLAFSVSTVPGSTSEPFHTFVTLAPRTSTWDNKVGLKSVIRAILTLGIIGYPFINPGPVGGSALNKTESPDEELYLRWLQLSIFLPVLQFSIHPKEFGEKMMEQAIGLIKLREEMVIPLLLTLANETNTNGFPIVRPLWWVAPNDSTAAYIENQFLLGNDLMVAPVLESNEKKKNIYFPHGLWQDATTKKFYPGGRWEYQLPVNSTTVYYFNRVNFTDLDS